VDCHNRDDWTANIAFDTMAPQHVADQPQVFEATIRKLRGHLMPPPGRPRPEQARMDSLVGWLETVLDDAARDNSSPGHVVLHRLNRTEYANEIERVLGLRVDPSELLPPDAVSDGFDNVANVLHVSPMFFEEYIAAARDISIRAVGDPAARQRHDTFPAPSPINQTVRVAGMPLGTRGGMVVDYHFPADGEYRISIPVTSVGGSLLRSYPTGWLEYRHKLILTIDDVRVFEGELGGEEDSRAVDQQQIAAVAEIQSRFLEIPVNVKAGPRRVGAAFVARTYSESDAPLEPLRPGEGVDSIPLVAGIEIFGPSASSGITETPSRRQIFVCRPEDDEQELPCAERILSRLARKAFRRPVDQSDMETLLAFYERGAEIDGFDRGIQRAIMAMLASPKFLYRLEPLPANAVPGSKYEVTEPELASRLSFFLWSQGPDEDLLEAAENGELGDPHELERQVVRMIADPKAKSLVTNFAFQWLHVGRIDVIDPDPRRFPNFDEDLRDAFRTEMELFLDTILLEDRSVLTLLDADHTFVNERLARHYGIPSVRGQRFRRVDLADSARWGLLGKGAVLMATSYPDRTSPVLRGQWILETLIGAPPAAPPPDVETNLATVAPGEQEVTVRARLDRHRQDLSCNQCHGVIDPLGMPLERFDAIGEWREKDRYAGALIDASSELVDGTTLSDQDDLRAALTARHRHFVQTMTEKLMTYALGRTVEYSDMPTVREIVGTAASDDYRFSSLVLGIVRSEPFRMKTAPEAEDPSATTAAALRH
jgi:hypothetical protein